MAIHYWQTHLREQKAIQVDRPLDHLGFVLPQFDADPICLFVYRSTPTQKSSGCEATSLSGEFHLYVIQIRGVFVMEIECRAKQWSIVKVQC
jgi:hypothetical protein